MHLDPETRAALLKLIENCQRKTAFDRKGHTYVLDAYVKVDPKSQLARQMNLLRKGKPAGEGFHRLEQL